MTSMSAVGFFVTVLSLIGGEFAMWREPIGDWKMASEVSLREGKPERFTFKTGSGIAVNGRQGRTKHLISKVEHADVEAHIEFAVAKGSNSGVYFQGRYEVQILDSWGVKGLKHGDCGGIYQRWKDGQGYEGHPPRINACRAPGEWQSFDVIFRAPRFDADGNKTENAKFIKVVHNGEVVHENVEVTGPTRASLFEDEKPVGPLMLQGDHGPVAYRNVTLNAISLD